MKNYLYLIAICFLAFSCQREEELFVETPQEPAPEQEHLNVIPGHIRIKLKAETATPQILQTKSGGVTTGIQSLDLSNLNLGTYHMKRVFVGKYENLLKKAGLDRWYDIYFDEKVPTRSAVDSYKSIPEIEKVEQIYEARPIGATPIPEYMLPVMQLSQIAQAARRTAATRADGETVTYPFNDPELHKQWHYHNDGSFLDGSIAGADINLFEAWKIETGSPNVIVAVMDGGIQAGHNDLAANMWTNSREIPGNDTDDDNNGYVDDIHGFNFVTAKTDTVDGRVVYSKGALTQYEHGTHCAGTISAVNGNKIGVCGIAGGSGKGDGVRLMSCQIFHMEGDKSKGSTDPNMYIYAADNGAVISQNSWTIGGDYDFMNSALKEAIDYFITYAGCGADGQQLADAPMKGGLVIFAAANDNTDVKAWPAAYEKNLRVAAMGPMFEKAVYSNYGDWIDLTAPGGEQSLGDTYGILSTTINNGYKWLQGTSMACPHVSGCAALILSKFQGPGFTANDLRERIMNTLQNIDQYNPGYEGKLGKGYIDVGAALTPATEEPPVTTDLTLIDSYDDWAIVEWKIATAADGPINKYELYWSEEPIVGHPENKPQTKVFDVRFKAEGDAMRDTVKGLELGKKYYYTLRGIDRWGNISAYAPEVSREVTVNSAPVLTQKWAGHVVIDEGSTQTLEFDYNEPEGQEVTLTLTPAHDWIATEIKGNTLAIVLTPDFGDAGVYNMTLDVQDLYGKRTTRTFAFQVDAKIVAPIVTSPIANVIVKELNKEQAINLNQVFTNPSHGKMIFEVTNSDNSVAWVQRKDDNLVISGKKNGITNVQVRAINENNLSTSTSFTVSVQSSATATETWSTYPEAISTDMTILLASQLQGKARIRIYNAAGKQLIATEVMIGDTGYVVDMSSLSKGIYVLTVEAGGQKLTKNIVKI